MFPNKRDLKAYVRYDGSGRVVPGSLILRRKKPKVGVWTEVQGYECCTSFTDVTITTTVSTNLSGAPTKLKLYCGNPSAELLSSTGWTTGVAWTGNFTSGFTHVTGNTTPLTNTLAAETGANYYIIVTVSGTVATTGATLTFGGVTTGTFGTTTGTFAYAITATGTGTLSITPGNLFTGTVKVSIVKMPDLVYTLTSITNAALTSVANLVTALNNTYSVLGTFSTTGGNNLTLEMPSPQRQAICSNDTNIQITVTP